MTRDSSIFQGGKKLTYR